MFIYRERNLLAIETAPLDQRRDRDDSAQAEQQQRDDADEHQVTLATNALFAIGCDRLPTSAAQRLLEIDGRRRIHARGDPGSQSFTAAPGDRGDLPRRGRSHTFDCGWDVKPRVVYMPSAAYWPKATPVWMHDRRDEILARLRRDVGGSYVIKEDEEPDHSPRAAVFGTRPADPPDHVKGVIVLTAQEWATVFGTLHAEGSHRGEWAAVLLEHFDFEPFSEYSPPREAAAFAARHKGKTGMGSTPEAAVDHLRKLTGRPDLQ